MIDCKHCGMNYDPKEYDLCPYCGQDRLDDQAAAEAEEVTAKIDEEHPEEVVSEKNKIAARQVNAGGLKYLLIGLAAVAVIAAVLFGFFALRDSGITVPDKYETIQEAIDAASDGDEIVVQVGVYRENIDFKGKNILIRSTDPDDPAVVAATIIDGDGRGPVVSFRSGESESAALIGLAITRGGGILISGGSIPVIEKCVIEDNTAEFGAGLFIVDSNPTIRDNSINGNSAYVGGGLFIEESSPIIEGNNIFGNYAEMGSGIAIYSNSAPIISDNEIAGNSAARLGGAIFVTLNSAPIITGNTISNNLADVNGGGLFIEESEPVIENNLISGNQAENGGGMIIVFINNPNLKITGNTFSENIAQRAGGGIYFAGSSLTIENNSFIDNISNFLGGAVAAYNSLPRLINNEFVGNVADNSGGGGALWLSSDSTLEINEPDDNTYRDNEPDSVFRE
jgi:parallel beta-helix repeat protein